MVIKSPGPSFDEPLEMLAACHERIAAQLATLERMAPHLERKGCDAEAKSAAQAVLRYFDSSGTLHHQDEDQDLFPLLRSKAASQERADILAAIEELQQEHEAMEAQWKTLRERLKAIAAGEARLDSEPVARFVWLYRRHMDRESTAVLPFAKQALDPAQRAALGQAMAARRKLPGK
jgi:pyridoxamine 5'-phosphate oxidase